MGQSNTSIYFKGLRNGWNSVQFKFYDENYNPVDIFKIPEFNPYIRLNRSLMERRNNLDNWINKNESLPDIDDPILVFDGGCGIGIWDGAKWWFGDYEYELKYVTHWMPMPEDPIQ
jgi:hypothetical protein